MKKAIALLLALVMVLGMVACGSKTETPADTTAAAETTKAEETKAEDTTAAPAGVEKVTYYCSIGAYLNTLQACIDEYNAGQGVTDGVYIELTSDINEYSTNLTALMDSGNFYDLVDAGASGAGATYYEKGYLADLYEVAASYPELQELVDSYEPYIINGVHAYGSALLSLPLEVVPIKLAVNLDLFEKNDLELPETWADVVNAAQVITENGGGEEFGWGWTTWSIAFRRLAMKESMNSVGTGWWDPNTESYDFAPFETIITSIATMYQNGWILGADELGIDEIRAQFAAGKVAMFPAPSYDFGVYTSQFPAECNWAVIDCPAYEDGQTMYKGIYLNRYGCAITNAALNVSDAHSAAVVKALCFINGDETNGKCYAAGGMIPYKQSIIDANEVTVDGEQFAQFADISNYTSMSLYPDGLIPLEGDTFEVVFRSIMLGDLEWNDELIQDLNDRYNAGYQELKESGDVDVSMYAYTYDTELK